jgi:hypothetical protein
MPRLEERPRDLHVLPRRGGWLVETAVEHAQISWHETADRAELAASRHAAERGARIFLHDAYERVRAVPARPVAGAG